MTVASSSPQIFLLLRFISPSRFFPLSLLASVVCVSWRKDHDSFSNARVEVFEWRKQKFLSAQFFFGKSGGFISFCIDIEFEFKKFFPFCKKTFCTVVLVFSTPFPLWVKWMLLLRFLAGGKRKFEKCLHRLKLFWPRQIPRISTPSKKAEGAN